MRISQSEYEELLKCRKMLEEAEMKQGLRESEKHQQKEDKMKSKKEDEELRLAMEDSKKSSKKQIQAEKQFARDMKKATRNSLGKGMSWQYDGMAAQHSLSASAAMSKAPSAPTAAPPAQPGRQVRVQST